MLSTGTTSVSASSSLLVGSRSPGVVTLAVFSSRVPGATDGFTVTVKVKVFVWLTASAPTLQVTVLPAAVQPLADATKVTPAGSESVITAALLGAEPLLVTASVYVSVLPTLARVRSTDLTRPTSMLSTGTSMSSSLFGSTGSPGLVTVATLRRLAALVAVTVTLKLKVCVAPWFRLTMGPHSRVRAA